MKEVRAAFERALSSADAVADALGVTEAFLAAHPGHLVATAYEGSLHAMMAGAAQLPWVKLKHANIASVLLDAAHERRREAAAPEPDGAGFRGDLEILLLRGVAYANFPAFLGKAGEARASLREAMEHPAFAAVPAPYQALANSHLATLSHRVAETDRVQ